MWLLLSKHRHVSHELYVAKEPVMFYIALQSTTTGYGDFVPHSAAEQVFANIYMIMGMVLFGLLVGTVANALTRASVTAAQLYQ
jgi:hypothetical protein